MIATYSGRNVWTWDVQWNERTVLFRCITSSCLHHFFIIRRCTKSEKRSMNILSNSWFRASWFNVNKKVQLDATVCRYLFTAQSLYMFRVSQHPSSGVLKTVSATSGIGHDAGTATSFRCGLIRPRRKEVAVPASWPIPEVADTVFNTPDDGFCDTRNM